MARIHRRTIQKNLHNPDNHDGVITHLEPDILECEVKWALESITTNKASGGDGIPVELFQILKDDAVKVLHSICQQIWKTQKWPQDWKRSVFIPIPKKGNARNAQTTTQLHSSHTLVKWCSKFSKLGFSNTWTVNFQMFKLVLERAEEPEIKLPIALTRWTFFLFFYLISCVSYHSSHGLFFFSSWLYCMAWRILFPWGLNLALAVKAPSPNHWTVMAFLKQMLNALWAPHSPQKWRTENTDGWTSLSIYLHASPGSCPQQLQVVLLEQMTRKFFAVKEM